MAGKHGTVDRTPVRVVLISLDGHLATAVDAARLRLKKRLPGLELSFHAASDWEKPEALARAKAAIAEADIIVSSMLFIEMHINAVLEDLEARRPHCDAMVGCLAASEVVKLTKLGRFDMSKPASGPIALMKRLRGSSKQSGSSGAKQMKTLRRLPKILKYIPGTAQDVRAYFVTMQYWLAGSEENIENVILFLLDRYAAGPRAHLKGRLSPAPPAEYPETGLYHPRLKARVTEELADLPLKRDGRPRVGVLIMRSYVMSEDTAHYDGAIAALEARGLDVIPAFASGLDAREATGRYFMEDGRPTIDALVSLTGFSLVGGPAFNDCDAAVETLKALDVPYICGQGLEFQTLSDWGRGPNGLTPVETTMMVALPELDGATGPIVFGGRGDGGDHCSGCQRECASREGERRMMACGERVEMLAARVEKLARLKRTERADARIAVTLFNFPPNSGAVGTAAHLSVFESLFNLMARMKSEGYAVDLPESAEALRRAVMEGNSAVHGTEANVVATIPSETHLRGETRLSEIEAVWGPSPGRQLSDGRGIHVLGARFGNVLVAIQPAFGFEGDPMRLLFDKAFAPTHAFSAYYRYIREAFGAHAVLHFGTHGALEFMPGKQVGLNAADWSDSLISDLPNFYFYAANNPSEATIAKRRSGATVVSYLTPAVTKAGLYKGLADLKSLIERWRATAPEAARERADLAPMIQAQGVVLDLCGAEPEWTGEDFDAVEVLRLALVELEETLIPEGLHVAGQVPSSEAIAGVLAAMPPAQALPEAAIAALAKGEAPPNVAQQFGLKEQVSDLEALGRAARLMGDDHEIPALIHAIDGGFTPPVAGGDLIQNPDILPTGRNVHGFDPFRLPSTFAVAEGTRQADQLIHRHEVDAGKPPETVAIVLWGTDNLKSEGTQIAQAMALIGATPRRDSYGRLSGADLIPLAALGRARIDVVTTLSGIFRDLLPMQTRMLAEAALKAAKADEPESENAVRRNALALVETLGIDLETAALRVFSNADGAYGSDVNQIVDAGCWEEGSELADAFMRRKGFAYGTDGMAQEQAGVMAALFARVDMAFQNVESVETGLTTIDHYFDTLGGIGRAVSEARGADARIYVGDATTGEGKVRSLAEQVALETRTRTLNPKWYEGMLRHGYEGVRQIEAQVTNTMGWSATTGQVAPWVYERLTETFVLDAAMRERLAILNPAATAKVAHRLIEASERNFWSPDAATLEALRRAGDDLEDRMEGLTEGQHAGAVA